MLKKFLKIIFVFGVIFVSVRGNAGIDSYLNTLTEADETAVGKWQDVPFGKVRLVSCSNGVKDFSTVAGGLQIQLSPEWYLKKPTLKPLNEKASFWSEEPLLLNKEFYTEEVFFPLAYKNIVRDTKDFEFGIQGDFPVCHKGKCADVPIRLSLPLSANHGNYTSLCAYILQQQRSVPQPAELFGIKGYAWKLGEGEAQLLFTGIPNVNFAFLYPPKEEADVSETRLEPGAVFMRLKKDIQILPSTYVLLTNSGAYRIPIELVKGPVNYSDSEVISSDLWLAGWELFFLTPLFIWWGLGVPKNSKIWKKQIIKLGLCFPVFFLLKMMLCHWGGSIFSSLLYAYFSAFLLGIVCLFPPQKWYWALGLFLIWPLSIQVPSMSAKSFWMWGIFTLFEISIPFVFLYLKASEIGKFLREMKKKQFFTLNFCFLLPTTIMLIFTIKQIYTFQISYSTEINPNGLTVVCKHKECVKWQKLSDVSFIDPETTLGESLQKIYGREGKSLIIWKDQEGNTILPSDISPNRMLKFINGRKSYRALGKP